MRFTICKYHITKILVPISQEVYYKVHFILLCNLKKKKRKIVHKKMITRIWNPLGSEIKYALIFSASSLFWVLKVSIGMLFLSFWAASMGLWGVIGELILFKTADFSKSQMCSMEFMSGEFAGHGSLRIFSISSAFWIILVLWGLALSSMKLKLAPILFGRG